ncbi:MAG TPA: outer membrane beta-barrel protein [Bacteroidales bacterium]|nr:outer membrane beta-barrel protein [Bacteroidales bacterium]
MKIGIVLFFLLVTPLVFFAQDFNGGLLFGIAGTEISGDRLEGPNKAGIYAGGFVNRYFTEKSSFQMELDFIQKGSRLNPDSTNGFSSYLLRVNYAELILHYKWDFHPMFTFEVGPSLGVLINSYEEADYQLLDNPFEWYDLNANFGLFYHLNQRWSFNIRYSNSVLPVRPHSQGQTYKLNKGQYNEVLSFTFHYLL